MEQEDDIQIIRESFPDPLPWIDSHEFPSMKLITSDTLAQIVQGNIHSNFLILDCRFPFEYQGGHVTNSINTPTLKAALQHLFDAQDKPKLPSPESLAIILHCEFSTRRAPTMYDLLRTHDRKVNPYPNLSYPHLYLLQGGYKNFFGQFDSFCEPKGYVSMFDTGHLDECRACMGENRRQHRGKHAVARRYELNRSQSDLPALSLGGEEKGFGERRGMGEMGERDGAGERRGEERDRAGEKDYFLAPSLSEVERYAYREMRKDTLLRCESALPLLSPREEKANALWKRHSIARDHLYQ